MQRSGVRSPRRPPNSPLPQSPCLVAQVAHDASAGGTACATTASHLLALVGHALACHARLRARVFSQLLTVAASDQPAARPKPERAPVGEGPRGGLFFPRRPPFVHPSQARSPPANPRL